MNDEFNQIFIIIQNQNRKNTNICLYIYFYIYICLYIYIYIRIVARDKNVCGLNCKDHMQFLDLTQISLANRKLSVKSTNKTGKKNLGKGFI